MQSPVQKLPENTTDQLAVREVVSPPGNPAFAADPVWTSRLFDPTVGYTFGPVGHYSYSKVPPSLRYR